MKTSTFFVQKFICFLLLVSSAVEGQNCRVIYDVNFNNHSNVQYNIDRVKSDFGNIKPYTGSFYRGIPGPTSNSLIEQTPQISRIENGTLRAEYLKNDASGRAGGFLFDPYFTGVEEAYLEYRVKFGEDFVWASGGKLPGLGGSTLGKTSETVGRGKIPSGGKYDETGTGFSARLMWRRNTSHTDTPYLILYSYFAKKQNGSVRKDGDFGDQHRIFTGLQGNKWYKIKQYIKLNTPGIDNGIVKMWIDGELLFESRTLNMRKSGKSDLKINALVMNTYRGGSRSNSIWHSPRTEYAYFDDFKVWTGCSDFPNGTTNSAPQVSISKPINNSVHQVNQPIDLTAIASDDDNNLQKVNFKINNDFFKTDSEAPYNAVFTPTTVGTYEISAKAFDTEGLTNEKKVTITVVDNTPDNQAPTVFISEPINNSSYELGDVINLAATATDSDNNLSKINFKINDNFYNTDTTAPYGTTFTPTATGSYKIAAKAFDAEGLADEKFVTITVEEPVRSNQKPSVTLTSPAEGSTFELGETIALSADGSDPEGSLEKINFLIDDAFYRTDSDLPYQASFTPTEVGTYKVTALAFDADGLTEESVVTINVITPAPTNQDPVVNVTAPLDGQVFELGETISFSATATDPDNNLEKINFKIDDNFYQKSTNNPFNALFTPSAVGEYKIAARAFDTNGAFHEAFVTISIVEPAPVNQAPVVSITSPADGGVYELGETINFGATATDADGNLEKINFKINEEYYRTSLRSPGSQVYTPNAPGTYKIAARAFDTEGLTDEKFVTITVVDPALSNEDFSKEAINVKVYPNPATNILHLSGVNANTDFSIVDITGKILNKGKTTQENVVINIATLAKGLYFVKIVNNTSIKTMSFIKQ